MANGLEFTADWERLDSGSPEERACFAALGIYWNDVSLTLGQDSFVNRIRPAPLLSAYHLAEWLAWNWWRLRWEPRSNASDWLFAHRLATIGSGYIWPNITVFSDGERVALVAKPSQERSKTAFRYLSDMAAIVDAGGFEAAVDRFIEQVRGQLRLEKVRETNLDRVWLDVLEERRDPEAAKRRKLEALMGCEPDRSEEVSIERLVSDAEDLGEQAVDEVAADQAQGGDLLTAKALRGFAKNHGFDTSLRDVVGLTQDLRLPPTGKVPAWRLGAEAANALRQQERLGERPLGNAALADLIGVDRRALIDLTPGPRISFALDTGADKGRVVLRSRWPTGRRFELARLLGDRLVARAGGRLFPATRAYTYRQKMQRSFAAELLSPFEAVDEMLAGDYSAESQEDVAAHFKVSVLTIRTLLVNHRRIDRDELDGDFDAAA